MQIQGSGLTHTHTLKEEEGQKSSLQAAQERNVTRQIRGSWRRTGGGRWLKEEIIGSLIEKLDFLNCAGHSKCHESILPHLLPSASFCTHITSHTCLDLN